MRPILAVVLGAIVAALLAWVACLIISEATDLPGWACTVAWVVAIIAWIVWAFPRYFDRLT